MINKKKQSKISLNSQIQAQLSNVHIESNLHSHILTQLKMIQLTETDLAILRVQIPVLKENAGYLVEKFYNNLKRVPSLGEIIKMNSSVDMLRITLERHISEMFNGTIDQHFISTRIQIAVVHARIGLEPKWYMSAFQDLLNGFFHIVSTLSYNSMEKIQILNAITKILNFEQQIVLETYEKIHREEQERESELKSTMVDTLRTNSISLADITKTTNKDIEIMSNELLLMEELALDNLRLADIIAKKATNEQVNMKMTQQHSAHLQAQMVEIHRNINELQALNGNIKNIAKMVTQIANKTNLLALNASIEATHAGKHGKGFSVVATEVRNLAENTKSSLSEIEIILNETNNKTNIISINISSIQDFAKIEDSLITSSSDSFVNIVTSMNDLYERNEDLSNHINNILIRLQSIRESSKHITTTADHLASF